MYYLVANFKSYKDTHDVLAWLSEAAPNVQKQQAGVTVIICPQYPALEPAKKLLTENNWHEHILLGAQNVSAFGEGAFTGEVSARGLSGLAEYVIIGHSERRKLFHETREDIEKKTAEAYANNLKPILCVSEETVGDASLVGDGIVAFEPPSAIGSGNVESEEKIREVTGRIEGEVSEGVAVLYGGSVSGETIGELLTIGNISGFLVGSAGLDVGKFLEIFYGVCKSRRASERNV